MTDVAAFERQFDDHPVLQVGGHLLGLGNDLKMAFEICG
jgi:hypothetical protein